MKETEDSTSEGREEEVETLSPCLDPDSQHTGAILGMLMRAVGSDDGCSRLSHAESLT